MSTTTKTELVRRDDDSGPDPLIGQVLGREDEDRVIVAWGDSRHSDHPENTASVEDANTLTPWTPKLQRRADLARGLRALADFYETNPDLELPSEHRVLNYVGYEADPKAAMAAQIRAALAAKVPVAKDYNESYGSVTVDFGGEVTLYVYADRDQVCERVVVGSETVTREVPDPEALAAVPKRTVTETVEKVEWVCSPLLATAEQVA